MALGPDSNARFEAIRRLLASGQAPDAVALLQQVVAADPADAEARALLGVALGMSGKPAEGAGHLETAVRLAPQQPSYLFNLGQVREQSGDRSGAVTAYGEALQINPNYERAVAAYQRLVGGPFRPASPGAGVDAPATTTAAGTAPWLVGAPPVSTVPGGHAAGVISPMGPGGVVPAGLTVGAGPRSIAGAPQIIRSIRWLYWLGTLLHGYILYCWFKPETKAWFGIS